MGREVPVMSLAVSAESAERQAVGLEESPPTGHSMRRYLTRYIGSLFIPNKRGVVCVIPFPLSIARIISRPKEKAIV